MSSDDVVIVSAARTPQGRLKGALASLSAVDLGAVAARRALAGAGSLAGDVDRVIFGQVVQAGAGQNPARQTAVAAGVAWDVQSVTINKVCLSGLTAVIDGARMLRTGEASVVLAGGQESMTNAPHLLPGSRTGYAYGPVTMQDSVAHDALTDSFDRVSMGESTEEHNTGDVAVSREEQDAVAAASHQRAAAAWKDGVFEAEIAPVSVPQRRGEPVEVAMDEGVRPDTTAEGLANLRPAFTKDGTLTAGNSSQISDGAAALVLTTRARAEAAGVPVLATVRSWGQVAGPDNSLHSQPAHAIEQALGREGWSVGDLDVVEINEAFAVVAVVSARRLGLSMDQVNVHGGGISVGHPVGASGARIAVHAAHELARRGGGRAAVALCGGGGQGEALLLEA
ncbi:acetyl-CoA C-acyltransferase [Myceligenerans pegani]|uniref:Probable acetyl-CoA acetyltransferase n=1 Tax=Myceligenerans pegani TaxID=2776917 RepID=A0ABR9MYN0_9MICO|nr:acetyl-CoA C-acyltransferase [Myceligenerans sp. TRM 65318]MBE1876146.1 acetyl-CoA C-acyltransferase [Myceligenerans sp. TRM 65318]MBE3018417.1 acetyl-CoA C-acyltransferase [Myceligenerans sp. TRM 65318]